MSGSEAPDNTDGTIRLVKKYEKWRELVQPTLDFVDAALEQRRTAIDVGAAEGLITEWLAQRFDLVHAFEPVPENFALLTQKDWGARVICHNLAVGAQAGAYGFLGKGHGAHISGDGGGRAVQVTTLDDLQVQHVDFIKIDVEGYETRVIKGAEKLIARCRPMIMFERKHLFRTRYGDEDPRAILERLGYRKKLNGPRDTVMAFRHAPEEPA